MEGRLLLKNCSVFCADGRIRDGMAVLIENGTISKIAPNAEIPALPGDWAVSCEGRLVAPGLVDCHTHLVGGQLEPFSGEACLRPPPAQQAFQDRLESFLTAAEIEVLSASAMARALLSGTTMMVEHLRCPRDVEAGLAAQARVAQRLGARLTNSHASTHRSELEANAAYAQRLKGDAWVRPAVGFLASYASDDELLRDVCQAREALRVGVHYHLAESEDDLSATFDRYGVRVTTRMEKLGLLGDDVVVSHAVAINREESELLRHSQTFVALLPRLEMSAAVVGHGMEAVLAEPNVVGLGTAGFGNPWAELFAAFVKLVQLARSGRLLDPDGCLAELFIRGPSQLCSRLFGTPSGAVEVGSLADLVVYDFVPAHDAASGLAPSLLMQLGQARVAWTIVGGRVAVREGVLLGHDFLELSREAARVLQLLWSRAGVAGIA